MTRPLRVLHVVSRMDPGGVETWLLHVLRASDSSRVRFSFYALSGRPGVYDNEIRERGGQIIYAQALPRAPLFVFALLRDLIRHGPFDVVHSHVHTFGGLILAIARLARVPARIAHSHLDTRELDRAAGLLRRIYLALLRCLIARFSTLKLATSDAAARALFGDAYGRDSRVRIHFCALDFSCFGQSVDPGSIREALNLPSGSFVVGHVGRFEAQKNHALLLEAFAALLRRHPDARLVLVGDGPLRSSMVERAQHLGIASHVIFTGLRRDVPQLMLGAFDVFAFPSHYEGLGLVVLEAQAAGLPCVIADTVPEEVNVSPKQIIRMSRSAGPQEWANSLSLCASSSRFPGEALACIRNSSFSIERGAAELLGFYEDACWQEPRLSSSHATRANGREGASK